MERCHAKTCPKDPQTGSALLPRHSGKGALTHFKGLEAQTRTLGCPSLEMRLMGLGAGGRTSSQVGVDRAGQGRNKGLSSHPPDQVLVPG